jgi:hypothetical protein
MAGIGSDVMRPWYELGSPIDACYPSVSTSEEKPKKKRGICLVRMKSRKQQQQQQQQQQHQEPKPTANNNNVPFNIHCQIGKEIKHICNKCRSADPLEGEGN